MRLEICETWQEKLSAFVAIKPFKTVIMPFYLDLVKTAKIAKLIKIMWYVQKQLIF